MWMRFILKLQIQSIVWKFVKNDKFDKIFIKYNKIWDYIHSFILLVYQYFHPLMRLLYSFVLFVLLPIRIITPHSAASGRGPLLSSFVLWPSSQTIDWWDLLLKPSTDEAPTETEYSLLSLRLEEETILTSLVLTHKRLHTHA